MYDYVDHVCICYHVYTYILVCIIYIYIYTYIHNKKIITQYFTYVYIHIYIYIDILCPDTWCDWVPTDEALRPGQCLVQCLIPQLQLASACHRHLCVPILKNLAQALCIPVSVRSRFQYSRIQKRLHKTTSTYSSLISLCGQACFCGHSMLWSATATRNGVCQES